LIAVDYEAKVANCHPPYSPIRGSLTGQSGLWPAQHDSNVRPTP